MVEMKRKTVLGLLLIVIITSSFFVGNVNAWSSLTYSDFDVEDSNTDLQTGMLLGTSNKQYHLKPYTSGSTRYLLSTYDAEGGLLQEGILTYNDFDCSSSYPLVYGYLLFNINSTHIGLLFTFYGDCSGNAGYSKIFIYEYISNSFTDSNNLNIGSINDAQTLISKTVAEYDDDYYFFTTCEEDAFRVLKYDFDTNTLSKHIEIDLGGGVGEWGYPLVVQDSNNTDICIVGFAEIDTEYPKYYKLDLDAGSSSHLADHPITAGRLDTLSVNNDGSRVAVVETMTKQIDADIIYNGTQVWVYFTWLNSYMTSVPTIRPVQHRLVFNTSISSGNLLGQNERTYTINPNSVNNETMWVDGYTITKDNFLVFYPNSVGGENKIYQQSCVIDDWWNYGISSTDISTSAESTEFPLDGNDESYWDDNDYVYRDWSGGYIVVGDESNDMESGWLYYGGEPTIVDYDITLSYSPSDSPLIVDKQYTFTVTTFVNDIGTSKLIYIYIDDIQQEIGWSRSNGVYGFYFSSGVAGSRKITVKIVNDYGVIQYEEDFYYTWIRTSVSDEPTSDILIPRTTSYVVAMLPTFIMVIMPTFAFGLVGSEVSGTIGGSIGFLLGAILGVGISAISGFLPMWIIYLFMLGLVSACVMIIRGGFGSG